MLDARCYLRQTSTAGGPPESNYACKRRRTTSSGPREVHLLLHPPWVFGKEPPHIDAVMAPCAGKAPIRAKYFQTAEDVVMPCLVGEARQ